MTNKYLIYGAGGHARVVAETVSAAGGEVEGFIDDGQLVSNLNGVTVGSYEFFRDVTAEVIIGIGNNDVRRKLANSVSHTFGIVIHPSAVVATDVVIGEGTVILANAVIQSGAKIGMHVIINANCCVDHDSIIEDFAHVYPNAYIGGEARVCMGVTVSPGHVIERKAVYKG